MAVTPAIPTPPRAVPLKTALRYRWPLALVSLLVPITAGLPLLIVLLVTGVDLAPFVDDALDQEASTGRGRVTAIEPTGLHSGSRRFHRVRYRFTDAGGREWHGASLVDAVELEVGAPCTVEYLADRPQLNRLEGTRRSTFGRGMQAVIGMLLLPCAVLFLWWLRGFTRHRLLLATGTAGEAAILGQGRVLGVNPPQLRVSYAFHDPHGQEHTGRHWVGLRSPLGRTLAEGARHATVVYDEAEPARSRLVAAEDFTPA